MMKITDKYNCPVYAVDAKHVDIVMGRAKPVVNADIVECWYEEDDWDGCGERHGVAVIDGVRYEVDVYGEWYAIIVDVPVPAAKDTVDNARTLSAKRNRLAELGYELTSEQLLKEIIDVDGQLRAGTLSEMGESLGLLDYVRLQFYDEKPPLPELWPETGFIFESQEEAEDFAKRAHVKCEIDVVGYRRWQLKNKE